MERREKYRAGDARSKASSRPFLGGVAEAPGELAQLHELFASSSASLLRSWMPEGNGCRPCIRPHVGGEAKSDSWRNRRPKCFVLSDLTDTHKRPCNSFQIDVAISVPATSASSTCKETEAGSLWEVSVSHMLKTHGTKRDSRNPNSVMLARAPSGPRASATQPDRRRPSGCTPSPLRSHC